MSVIAIPLNQLTKKNAVFTWNKEHENAFNEIKNILCNPTILAYPDYNKSFTLTVDASKQGCGAVLSQNGNPIAFASKSFTKAESNKATIEQELIAICWSIKHFKHYLYGTEFLVQSDHKPLVYLYRLKETNAKLTRLRLELAEYNFTIEHIKGKENVVADALSRIHINEIRTKKETQEDLKELQILAVTRAQSKREKENIDQKKDINKEVIQEKEPNIMHAINSNDIKGIPTIHTQEMEDAKGLIYDISVHHKYNSIETASCTMRFTENSVFAKQLLVKLKEISEILQFKKIKIHTNEVLFTRLSAGYFKDLGNQMNLGNLKIRLAEAKTEVTDIKTKTDLMKHYHDNPVSGGHCGTTKMYKKLNERYIWKGMYGDVKKYVNECEKCQLNKPKHRTVEPLVITDTPSRAFERVTIDTIGPLQRTENNNKYAVTMMCELTKYLVIAPIANKEAGTVAKAIMQNLVLVYGKIDSILTDQGTEYVNSIMNEMCENLGIEKIKSTPYHHETLGTIERNHRVLNEYLRSYLTSDTEWEEWLRYFAYCYNITPHSSFNCEYSPFELVYGKKGDMPRYAQGNRVDPIYNLDNFAKETKYRLQVMAQTAREMLVKNKENRKISYDRRVNPLDVKVGDKVIIRDETARKHDSVYRGPYTVISIKEPNITFKDEHERTKTVHKNNANKIKAN